MLVNALAAMFLAATMAATAAEAPVALRGVVLEASRMPMAGALVTAVAEAGGPVSKTRTDGRGAFVLALAPGRYVVMVVAPGFREARQGLDATAAGSAARDFVLELPSFRETVTVSAPPGYQVADISSATRTLTPLRDVPQAVTVATRELMRDKLMTGMGDVLRYVPGVAVHQGENNRDQAIIRGNSSSADFFLDGVRDDVQYYRDLYNLECVEALKGPTAMIFGRGGGGGVVNRVRKEAVFSPLSELTLQGGDYRHKRAAVDLDRPLSDEIALRVNGMYESSDSFRRAVGRERYALNPTLTFAPGARTKITLGYEHLHDTRVADRGIPSFQGRPADLDVSTFFGDPARSHVRARVDLGSATVEHHPGRLTIRNRTLFGDYDRFYQNFVPGSVAADKSRV